MDMIQEEEKELLDILNRLDIKWERIEHPPVYTVEEARASWKETKGAHIKNLFLRNYRGNRHYLVLAPADKKIDLKKLTIDIKEDRLSFASPERLSRYLGLKPGAVSPFGLINDREKAVTVVIDEELLAFKYLNFHPNTNTATLTVNTDDFKKFLAWCGHKVIYARL